MVTTEPRSLEAGEKEQETAQSDGNREREGGGVEGRGGCGWWCSALLQHGIQPDWPVLTLNH